jgi:alpha-1,2-mannosyltransferase
LYRYAPAWLCTEVARLNAFAGAMLTALLAWSAGMFAASTAFLPSSFAMYCVTTAGLYKLFLVSTLEP